MTIPPTVKFVGLLLAALALVAGGVDWYHTVQRNAVLEASIGATQHSLDSLGKVAAAVDTEWRTDTIRLTKATTVYTERRDTLLLHLTDTVQVKEFVQASDSVVRACSMLQLTCAERHTIDSATAAGWEREYRAERSARPSVVLTTGKLILAGLAGAVVGHSLK